MNRWLAVALFVFEMVAAASAQAKMLRTSGHELFCLDRAKFPEYLVALHDNQSKHRSVEGCRQPGKGTRYEVLEEGVETGIDKVRLYIGGRPTEGYLLNQNE